MSALDELVRCWEVEDEEEAVFQASAEAELRRLQKIEKALRGLRVDDDHTFTVVKSWGMEEDECSLCGEEPDWDTHIIAHKADCPVLAARAALSDEQETK